MSTSPDPVDAVAWYAIAKNGVSGSTVFVADVSTPGFKGEETDVALGQDVLVTWTLDARKAMLFRSRDMLIMFLLAVRPTGCFVHTLWIPVTT